MSKDDWARIIVLVVFIVLIIGLHFTIPKGRD